MHIENLFDMDLGLNLHPFVNMNFTMDTYRGYAYTKLI
jgi:hypothetical protein